MKSNFLFLEEKWPLLYKQAQFAENYLYTDPHACMIKLGLFAEQLIKVMMAMDQVTLPESMKDDAMNRIRFMQGQDLLPPTIVNVLHEIRKTRNQVAHEIEESREEAEAILQMGFHLACWFMETYGVWTFVAPKFLKPEYQDKDEMIQRLEQEIQRLSQEKYILKPEDRLTLGERQKRARTAASKLMLNEAETRLLIDEQLRKVGWETDSIHIHYGKGSRPEKKKNKAIAEWPTLSTLTKKGRADYALFCGEQLVGLVEAKKWSEDVFSAIDPQCKDYAKNIRIEDQIYTPVKYSDYFVPFLFASNGKGYLEGLETKSGIQFWDARKETNIQKALTGWRSPEGLLELLSKDETKANQYLQSLTKDFLTDPEGLNLRSYQLDAIQSAEQAVIEGKKEVLLAMATGTGKTRTMLGLMYRFLKAERFKRILFLVDRNALGEQAQDVFSEVMLEGLLPLTGLCDVKLLEDKWFEQSTNVHVATIQGMVRRILYNESDRMHSIDDYDLIVVDEAHRGYHLDQEMSEDEKLYRDQLDFRSKYQAVLQYFDAVKIGMTATPAYHTTEIFGPPVYQYSYREAVVEAHLCDHDVPHHLSTRLSEGGITYGKGEVVPIYDPETGEILNSDELEDELHFEVESFNRRIIVPAFNEAVLEEISKSIDPLSPKKTLIFAVDDAHADLIVSILKKIYSELIDLPDEAILKITGKTAGGNKKKILETIKKFKNEKYPSIAVTVDLLTTGIDVPKICNLVFMRRIKSRVLYEQMLGRATRRCDEIGKTHFEIFDPVGLYESLEPYSMMKPVLGKATTRFDDLFAGLAVLKGEEKQKKQIDLIFAKLQRRKSSKNGMIQDAIGLITESQDMGEWIHQVRSQPVEKQKAILEEKEEFFIALDRSYGTPEKQFFSYHPDQLLEHIRSYGKGEKPKDYLESFKEYIQANLNQNLALKILCTRPKELTRASLIRLLKELSLEGYTEQWLNTAWKDMTNQEIAADMISYIRQAALGSSLISHEERIKGAIRKLKANHRFTEIQLNWIERFEKYLMQVNLFNREFFSEVPQISTQTNFTKLDKIFDNQLESLIDEANIYLYEDQGA